MSLFGAELNSDWPPTSDALLAGTLHNDASGDQPERHALARKS